MLDMQFESCATSWNWRDSIHLSSPVRTLLVTRDFALIDIWHRLCMRGGPPRRRNMMQRSFTCTLAHDMVERTMRIEVF